MAAIEYALIQLLLQFTSTEALNAFLRDPRHVAAMIGALIAISGALVGSFLLLRGFALVSDAISHTVLLGIVLAFLFMTAILGLEADLNSPLLIIGASAAGVLTVLLTEALSRSGLVRQDAALGLIFPLLFAIAVILVSRFVEDVHLDEDAIMVGEIGLAWANTTSHCLANCQEVTITPDHPQAQMIRECTNCLTLGISPRDSRAEFALSCANCGTYSPAQAWRQGLVSEQPTLVFWPKALTTSALVALLTIGFVILFYKELKLAVFDPVLAQSLGFRPALLSYGLMALTSLIAVSAFDAVGSILVIAFFVIPPAAAYLLTDRLSLMLIIGAGLGSLGAWLGYDLARGSFLGLVELSNLLAWLNSVLSLQLSTTWDVSVSASMVLMIFFFFLLAWTFSPRYGVLASLVRRSHQRRLFEDQVVLRHLHNHSAVSTRDEECSANTLHLHLQWPTLKTQKVVARLRALGFIRQEGSVILLTAQGLRAMQSFSQKYLPQITHDDP
ncbi:MAG: metal ABC transporter permease [Anaerolineae bacterium]|nr:metal ABC transporter permease [Anaerolineae bacterium]MDW8173238.1 metal ABC transporter permease [Anaerolineae bacterium]